MHANWLTVKKLSGGQEQITNLNPQHNFSIIQK